MTDSIRAEFNTWWARQPFNAQFEDVKQQMFNVWVASRADCVVTLPKAWQTNIGPMLAPNGVKFAIEAAGLKVRL